MNPVDIVLRAEKDGVKFTLSNSGRLKVAGQKSILNTWMPILREHQAALFSFLDEKAIKQTIKEIDFNKIAINTGCEHPCIEPSLPPFKKANKIRPSPIAIAWLLKHREALDKAGWTRAELYRRNKSKLGIAWFPLWNKAFLKFYLHNSGVIEFKCGDNGHGRGFSQTAHPRNGTI